METVYFEYVYIHVLETTMLYEMRENRPSYTNLKIKYSNRLHIWENYRDLYALLYWFWNVGHVEVGNFTYTTHTVIIIYVLTKQSIVH